MSAKERFLHKIARSDLARGAYSALRRFPVVGSSVQKLVHAAMPPGIKIWVRIPAGLGKDFWMYADPRFELGYTNGDHEPWLQELLRSELRPGDCFYDVGAHTGFFALIASRFVGTSGKIVAFEPDPDNAATLKANMAKNDVTQLTLVEAVVWSSPGEVTFQRALGASNRTQGQIMTEPNPRLEQIMVPAIRLDDFIFEEGNPIPQLIKMDVEGAEWGALQGARKLLDRMKPRLLCEVHDRGQMGQIQDHLRQFGYAAEEWNPVHEHYADYRQIYLWAVPSIEVAAVRAMHR
jgi:FkbM family methyltransferase